MPAITVGLPCYGRPAFLKEALEHLARQSFRDFVVLVHENPSGAEDIRHLVEGFIREGAPFRYHRHPENLGIVGNFMSVLRAVETPFFLWAADDDLRHPDSLAILRGMLVEAPGAHLAACSVEVINSLGASIDRHAGFSRFTTSEVRHEALLRFLDEPEICGKANVIQGLFRTQSLREALVAIGGSFPECWGLDLVVLTAFLARFDMVGTDRILLKKRTNNPRTKPLTKRFPRDYGWPACDFALFRTHVLAAIPDEATRRAAAAILDRRQAHLTTTGAIRRFLLKALGIDSISQAQRARDEDKSNMGWI